jgi:hypothetical protein
VSGFGARAERARCEGPRRSASTTANCFTAS